MRIMLWLASTCSRNHAARLRAGMQSMLLFITSHLCNSQAGFLDLLNKTCARWIESMQGAQTWRWVRATSVSMTGPRSSFSRCTCNAQGPKPVPVSCHYKEHMRHSNMMSG